MRLGEILVEGNPSELRSTLNGRIIEVHGSPLQLLRQLARAEEHVEDAQMFGDRLHLRVEGDSANQVINHLKQSIPSQGGTLTRARTITPQLEDVFINLLETHPDQTGRQGEQ